MKMGLLKKIGLAVVFVLQGIMADAATVTLTKTDAMGQSSFNSGLNWSDSNAPSAANDYVVTGDSGFQFRTPIGPDSFTFGGNSLTMNGGTFFLKANKAATYTFNGGGLTLNAGAIQNATGGFLCTIAGNLFIGPKGGTLQLNNGGLEFTGVVTLNGPLGTDKGTTSTPKFNGPVNFGLDGKMSAISSVTFVQAMASVFTFEIGDRDTAYITGQGGSLLKGAFVFKLGPEDLVVGHSWKIVDTDRKTFTENFSVTDFKKVSDLWISNDGNYQFSESTGILSVVDKSNPASATVPAVVDKPVVENTAAPIVVEKPNIEDAKVPPVVAKPVVEPPKPQAPIVAAQPKPPVPAFASAQALDPESSPWAFWLVCGFGLLVAGGIVVLVIMLLRTFKS